MTPVEAAWLAGILEGEGAFILVKRPLASGETAKYPRIQLGMTDRDVVDRARVLVGAGRIYVQDRTETSDRHNKPLYSWAVQGPAARSVIEEIYPLLGERRRGRIDEILAASEATRARVEAAA